MDDYFNKYMTSQGFDLPRLINDDFLIAIKLCFNNQKYISAMKLMVSYIDTLGFFKYGNDNSAFIKWLDDYVDMAALGITAKELWEHRNSLLHMTTLKSKKVERGIHPILIMYVGELPSTASPPSGEKWFNFNKLNHEVALGFAKFTTDFIQPNFVLFVERYDLILSDHRYMLLDNESN